MEGSAETSTNEIRKASELDETSTIQTEIITEALAYGELNDRVTLYAEDTTIMDTTERYFTETSETSFNDLEMDEISTVHDKLTTESLTKLSEVNTEIASDETTYKIHHFFAINSDETTTDSYDTTTTEGNGMTEDDMFKTTSAESTSEDFTETSYSDFIETTIKSELEDVTDHVQYVTTPSNKDINESYAENLYSTSDPIMYRKDDNDDATMDNNETTETTRTEIITSNLFC